jgi:Zn-dependent protease with chaperone function
MANPRWDQEIIMGFFLWFLIIATGAATVGGYYIHRYFGTGHRLLLSWISTYALLVLLSPFLFPGEISFWFRAPRWVLDPRLNWTLLSLWLFLVPFRNLRRGLQEWSRTRDLLARSSEAPQWFQNEVANSPFAASPAISRKKWKVRISADLDHIEEEALLLGNMEGFTWWNYILFKPVSRESFENNRDEWNALIGHEFGHIVNHDGLLMRLMWWIQILTLPSEAANRPSGKISALLGFLCAPIRYAHYEISNTQETKATSWAESISPGISAEMEKILKRNNARIPTEKPKAGPIALLAGATMLSLCFATFVHLPGWPALERSLGGSGEIPFASPATWECKSVASKLRPGQVHGDDLWWAYRPDGPNRTPSMHVKYRGAAGRGQLMGSYPMLDYMRGVSSLRIEWYVRPFSTSSVKLNPGLMVVDIGDRFTLDTMKTDIWETPPTFEHQEYVGDGLWKASATIPIPPSSKPNQLYFFLRFNEPCDILVFPPVITAQTGNNTWVPFEGLRL